MVYETSSSSYRVFSTSSNDYVDEQAKVLDSFRAATSLLSALAETQAGSQANTTVTISTSESQGVESWTKSAVSKLKSSSITEKSELQKLNQQLQSYLENVKRLEAMNRALQAEVEKAKIAFAPKLMDKSSLVGSLGGLRTKLEEESVATVRLQSRIEANEILTAHINDRLRFFHQEAEVLRQKLASLQSFIADMNNQKEFMKRNAKVVEDQIAAEQARILQTEKDLEALLEKLKESRTRNKKLEFEMQTLIDEISFSKAVFNEEVSDMRGKLSNGIAFSGGDISNFFKGELAVAVRQIRSDFQVLNEHQLNEYRQLKEVELQSNISLAEHERIQMAKLSSSSTLELSAKELAARLEENKADIGPLQKKNYELSHTLNGLEVKIRDIRSKTQMELSRKQAEIEALRLQNEQFASEIEYWDRITRTKLESEIQTYRSILNSQIKLLESLTKNYVVTQKVVEEVKKPVVSSSVLTEKITTTSTKQATSSSLTSSSNYQSWNIPPSKVTNITVSQSDVRVLRQVFDYFDADKSGKINSNEFDRILSKLNVKLSREAYQKILRENDLDSKKFLELNKKIKN